MQAPAINTLVTDTAPVPPLTKSSKVKKAIAKLTERKLKIEAAIEIKAKELADADRAEEIEAGQTEFVRSVEELDLTAREMVISTVLESFEDDSRRATIQAWIAAIPEREPRTDPIHQQDKEVVSPGAEPAPAANPSKIPSTKPDSPASAPTPKE